VRSASWHVGRVAVWAVLVVCVALLAWMARDHDDGLAAVSGRSPELPDGGSAPRPLPPSPR